MRSHKVQILSSAAKKQQGLTLVELMVALVIGLFLLAGLLVIFSSSQQAYRMHEAMSRVQESSRIAIESVSREIRQAGFNGCPSGQINNLLDSTSSAYDPDVHSFSGAFADSSSPNGRLRGDWVTVVNATNQRTLTATGSGSGGQNIPPINIVGNSGVPQGTIVLVADEFGGSCDLFQQTTTASASNLQRASGGQSPGNRPRPGAVYSAFNGPIDVFELSRTTFFIRESEDFPGISSLYRLNEINDSLREVVSGVYDMRVEYGVDNNNNGSIDFYRSKNDVANWDRVSAVRLHLLFYSDGLDNVMPERITGLPFANGTFDAPDGRMYQAFTTTILARNRIN